MTCEIKIVTYQQVRDDTVPPLLTGEPYLFDRKTWPGLSKELRWELCRKGRKTVVARVLLKRDALQFARMLAKKEKKT